MAQQKKIEAPIDSPISKSYVRDFNGWVSSFSPSIAPPESFEVFENVELTGDSNVKVRPGLRSVLAVASASTAVDPLGSGAVNYDTLRLVQISNHEPFFAVVNGKVTRFLLGAERYTAGDTSAVLFYLLCENERGYYVKAPLSPTVQTVQGVQFVPFKGAEGAYWRGTKQTNFVRFLQLDNKIIALSDQGEEAFIFYVSSDQVAEDSVYRVEKVQGLVHTEPDNWGSAGALEVVHPTAAWIQERGDSSSVGKPTAQAAGTDTLISSDAEKNTFTYLFFFTAENTLGESKASVTTQVLAQRGWNQWRFKRPAGDGSDSGTPVYKPEEAMDQLVASIPRAVYNKLKQKGAKKWNLYLATWSKDGAVPGTAVLVGSQEITTAGSYEQEGWIACTAQLDLGSTTTLVPTKENRVDYSNPLYARQGAVVGDRLVVVNDSRNFALIRWSSNRPGEHLNFSSSKGGGQKTLSSGNLIRPVAVVLWQNPQSNDTITILCSGVDNYSTSYYMAPSQVEGQSSAVTVMGFEETTATPGTVSPYGVEVFNNALYHPLETELMKSTAANYNITHTTLTEEISEQWFALVNKENIQSVQYDNRLYYLVHNPSGRELIEGERGNEIWVYDTRESGKSWSRWLVGGVSLEVMTFQGRRYVAVVQPRDVMIFDPTQTVDELSRGDLPVTLYPTDKEIRQYYGFRHQPILWRAHSNVQGANRAHDAWVHLEQVEIGLSNWIGCLTYGIVGVDVHGHPVDIRKTIVRGANHAEEPPSALVDIRESYSRGVRRALQGEHDEHRDYLQVGRVMREWRLVIHHSSLRPADPNTLAWRNSNFNSLDVLPELLHVGSPRYRPVSEDEVEALRYHTSSGQLTYVGYKFVPASINVMLQEGLIDTEEYRSYANESGAIGRYAGGYADGLTTPSASW